MNYRTSHPISNNSAFAQWFQTKVEPKTPVSTGEPIELFSSFICQNVDFPEGLRSRPCIAPSWYGREAEYEREAEPVQRELNDHITHYNWLLRGLNQSAVACSTPEEQLSALQGVVCKLISDIIHICEVKWIRIKQGAAVAALVENKHRAAHDITGDYAKTFKAVLQKKNEFDLIRGASHQNRQFDTRREHANKHGPPQNAPNTVQNDRTRGRERDSVGGRNGANKDNKENFNPFKIIINPFEK
ncbi:hypothetical protein SARC_07308 [Sphaeroforma arctica JP610]|uniref:Uncharacterized protein n=1 Tax=Sphaeroforma arctica JP610 TaxID=667725 RepID=A0A0L0FWJ9_9EUKA|nr:hypothetical protein SARC_07308 [Sphaeroforma arctica JP610]KNC80333.1 hypothetical protein SARC_07308 [Sphaeroforma arctica JP610]|eukprot:XP_014154235.1 hypothetical protein SARC_07308 [Sphaeroforma arctica JP610]